MSADAPTFRRSEDNGVLTFTFTRDAKLNAVSPAMIDGLRAAVDDLGDRDDLKVLVIAAEGRYFTAGDDMKSPPKLIVNQSMARRYWPNPSRR